MLRSNDLYHTQLLTDRKIVAFGIFNHRFFKDGIGFLTTFGMVFKINPMFQKLWKNYQFHLIFF